MVDVQEAFLALGVSLGLGLLVGLQRERGHPHVAGLRTFALIAVLGTGAAIVSESYGGWALAAAMGGVAAAMVVGNMFMLQRSGMPPGVTTEIAILMMFVVGAMCWTGPMSVAVVAGAVTALLLHAKPLLHGIAQELGDKDVRAIMQFVLLAMVILPVLPDENYGPPPINVLNPRHIWLVVVLVVGISLSAYLLYRFLGSRAGMLIGGVLGGLISSTATSVSFARRARSSRAFTASAAAVIIIASTVVYLRVLAEIAVVAPSHFRAMAGPVVLLMAFSALLATLVWSAAKRGPKDWPEQENPTELRSALFFGLLYGVALVAAAWAKNEFGDRGLYVVAALSGLTHMDAITLTASRLAQAGLTDATTAWRAVIIGAMANQVFKLAAVWWLGGLRLGLIAAGLFSLCFLAGGAILILW